MIRDPNPSTAVVAPTFDARAALDLLDWKRQVFALYEGIRTSPEPRTAWELWRRTRDRLIRQHPQSPLPADRRGAFTGCDYFDYDPGWRAVARVQPAEPVRYHLTASTGAAFPFSRLGTALFEVHGEEHALDLFWNEGYGGGIFVAFQDETSGVESYPSARYLVDTVKGADLGIDDDMLVLDFNFAYNPSCAYDDRWACPLAPPGSRLPVAVRAGERTPPLPPAG